MSKRSRPYLVYLLIFLKGQENEKKNINFLIQWPVVQ